MLNVISGGIPPAKKKEGADFWAPIAHRRQVFAAH
jgi:hypothetical protein